MLGLKLRAHVPQVLRFYSLSLSLSLQMTYMIWWSRKFLGFISFTSLKFNFVVIFFFFLVIFFLRFWLGEVDFSCSWECCIAGNCHLFDSLLVPLP